MYHMSRRPPSACLAVVARAAAAAVRRRGRLLPPSPSSRPNGPSSSTIRSRSSTAGASTSPPSSLPPSQPFWISPRHRCPIPGIGGGGRRRRVHGDANPPSSTRRSAGLASSSSGSAGGPPSAAAGSQTAAGGSKVPEGAISSSAVPTSAGSASPPPSSAETAAIDRAKAFAIGSFAGLLGSLAGMGGGFVMIPLMTSSRAKFWGLGIRQHAAHGTSLFAVATTGLAGALAYGISWDSSAAAAVRADDYPPDGGGGYGGDCGVDGVRLVEPDVAFAVAVCGAATARLGAATTALLSERALKTGLGIFMLCVAPIVPGKVYLEEWRQRRLQEKGCGDSGRIDDATGEETTGAATKTTAERAAAAAEKLLPAGFVGLFSGYLAGLFGVGGGAVVVPGLAVVLPDEHAMSHRAALGTSLCAMIPPALAGTWGHHLRGNVDLRVAPALALGSFVGAYLGGTTLGRDLDEAYLRWGFSGLMVVLGVRILAKR